jgi:hypothetical protein
MVFILKEKLKILKGILKDWSMETFGTLDFILDQLRNSAKDWMFWLRIDTCLLERWRLGTNFWPMYGPSSRSKIPNCFKVKS